MGIALSIHRSCSMLLVGNCKGNGPGSHRSYFDDFDKES